MNETSYSCLSNIFSHPDKPLVEHLLAVSEIASKLVPVFLPGNNMKDAIIIAAKLHDLGKATTFFQNYLSASPANKPRLKNDMRTNHSLLSALATYWVIRKLYPEEPFAAFCGFFCVKHHHGNLKELKDSLIFDKEDIDAVNQQLDCINDNYLAKLLLALEINVTVDELKKGVEGAFDDLKKLKRAKGQLINPNNMDNFFRLNLAFSILIDADKSDAGLKTGGMPERGQIPSNLVGHYRQQKGLDIPTSDINKLRNEVYEEVLSKVCTINAPSILSLNVPTGLGKTLTTFAFAEALRATMPLPKPRIIYCLPFLSIIEQNYNVIERLWGDNTPPTTDQLLKHHHLSEISYKTGSDSENEYEIGEEKLLIEGWNSEIIVTTFIQFFHTVIGYQNKMLKKFNKIAGSIIILDEVQAIPVRYWRLIEEALKYLSERLHCYIVLSTATRPMIAKNCTELVNSPYKYFEAMDRYMVVPDIENPQGIDRIIEIIQAEIDEDKSVLVVLNTIGAADNVFSKLSLVVDIKTFFLSTHVTPYERIKRIEEIKTYDGQKLVISTQLVEAGVDIDLDVVIRDLAPFDCIMQSAGRCNRNADSQKIGKVIIVNMVDDKGKRYSSFIYDIVLMKATKDSIPKEEFCEKDCLKILQKYYDSLERKVYQEQEILKATYELNYDDGDKSIAKFKLIEDKYEKVDIFVEINEEAQEVWQTYTKLYEISDRWKRKEEFARIKGEFAKFVISVSILKASKNQPPKVNDIMYIGGSQLSEYYDGTTGFKTEGGLAIW